VGQPRGRIRDNLPAVTLTHRLAREDGKKTQWRLGLGFGGGGRDKKGRAAENKGEGLEGTATYAAKSHGIKPVKKRSTRGLFTKDSRLHQKNHNFSGPTRERDSSGPCAKRIQKKALSLTRRVRNRVDSYVC